MVIFVLYTYYVDESICAYIYMCVCTPIQHHSSFEGDPRFIFTFSTLKGPPFWVKAMKIIPFPLSRTFEPRISICEVTSVKDTVGFIPVVCEPAMFGTNENSPKAAPTSVLVVSKTCCYCTWSHGQNPLSKAVKNLEKMTIWWLSHHPQLKNYGSSNRMISPSKDENEKNVWVATT